MQMLDRTEKIDRGSTDVQVELTGLVYSRLLAGVISCALGLLAATGVSAYLFHDKVLWTFFGIAVLVCGAHVGVALLYRRRPQTESMSLLAAEHWEMLNDRATIAFSCMVAAVTLRIFWRQYPGGVFLCASGSVAFCAMLASRLGLRPIAMKTSGLVPLAALCIGAVALAQPGFILGCLLLVAFAIYYAQLADRNFEAVVGQIRTQRAGPVAAEQDALTLLPNRRQLRNRLTELCKGDTPFAVLFLDLDNFKPVNDKLGHGAGDEVLLQVADRLRSMMRESDLLARVGGDEFAILQIPAANKREVVALAERINQQIAAPYRILGERVVIGVSVGVRLASGGILKPDDLLHRADTALYNVKSGGKGGFSIAVD